MSPASAVALLDRALARDGQTVAMWSPVAGKPATEQTVRAFVRGYRPDELTDDIREFDSKLIVSPTGLAFVPSSNTEDRAVIDGRERMIGAVERFTLGNTLVRLEVQVKG